MQPRTDLAEKIFGWMQPEELRWLGAQAQKRKRIVEIGSYMGRSTRALADNTDGAVLAVDTWKGSTEHQIDLADMPPDCLFDKFVGNLQDHLSSGKVTALRMPSVEAVMRCMEEGCTFDMIFIDASHGYDDVRRDIMSWVALLEPGGIICGHDYSRFSGLNQAVQDSLPNFRVMSYPGSIWYAGDDSIEGRVFGQGLRRPKKTLYTLNVGLQFAPKICSITYPLLQNFADKCGATFTVITERKFPDWPITFEKLQIFELAQRAGADWNMYFDSDALIHPDTFDPTEMLRKDTVMHNGADMAANRWRYDNYFRRDGRNIGSGNWLAVASDWCLDLWKPPDDLTPEQAVVNIRPTALEISHGITAEHLIDDYLLSRNIARFGLKFKSYLDLSKELGRQGDWYFWHHYTVPVEDAVALDSELPPRESVEFKRDFYTADGKVMRKGKVTLMRDVLRGWGISVNEKPAIAPAAETLQTARV